MDSYTYMAESEIELEQTDSLVQISDSVEIKRYKQVIKSLQNDCNQINIQNGLLQDKVLRQNHELVEARFCIKDLKKQQKQVVIEYAKKSGENVALRSDFLNGFLSSAVNGVQEYFSYNETNRYKAQVHRANLAKKFGKRCLRCFVGFCCLVYTRDLRVLYYGSLVMLFREVEDAVYESN